MITKEVSPVTPGYRTSGIGDLPPEVLSEVASHLEFIDILSLQQTSKKLRESTEAHVVWLTLAEKYSDQHFHLYRSETGSFADLKTNELRAWVQKRLVVDEIWRARGAQPHFRMIYGSQGSATLKLVPGTRWLLVGYADGSVCSYDLDSEGLKGALLTPPSREILESADDIEIHVDEGASRLEFKLVVHWKNGDFSTGLRDGHFHMWQVKLEDDGNSLVAKPLNSIPYRFASINSLALGRRLLVCGISSLAGPSWVEVIWWEQCSATSDLRTRFSTGWERIDKIHLIGDDKILCVTQDGVIWLYTLPEPNHTNGYMQFRLDQLPSREPIWSHSLSRGGYKHGSPVYYNGTTYRLAVNVGNLIWGLVVPVTKDDDPSVVMLLDIPQTWDRCFLGVCKAYAFCYASGTSGRIGYSWGDGGGISTIRDFSEKPKDVMPYDRHSIFDEEVGRLVYRSGNNIVVEDYFH